MPFVEVNVIENVFTREQKNQIITRLTDALVSIEGKNMRAVPMTDPMTDQHLEEDLRHRSAAPFGARLEKGRG